MSSKKRSRVDQLLDALTRGLAKGIERSAGTLPWIVFRVLPLVGLAEFLRVIGLSGLLAASAGVGTGLVGAITTWRK
jgi:hypothetical protein